MLGQVFGDYEIGLTKLGIDRDDESPAASCGFTLSFREFNELRADMGLSPYDSPEIYGPLTEEWKKAISARLGHA